MDTNLSLDDIIQKKYKGNVRGRKGGRVQRGGKDQNNANVSRDLPPTKNKNVLNKPAGGQARRKGRGGINSGAKPIGDARLRIIQQKRQKITDARDKLGEIAKMSDARVKLNHLKTGGGGTMAVPKLGQKRGITIETGRNGQIQLRTNKAKAAHIPKGPYKEPGRTIGNGRGRVGNTIIPSLLDIDLDVDDSPLLLRRTVNNSLLTPPVPPLFSSQPQREMYSWIKPSTDDAMDESYNSHVPMARSRPAARPLVLRESILGQSLRRQPSTNIRIHTRNISPKPTSDWFLGERITRRTSREDRPESRERPVDSDDEEPLPRSRNDSNIRSGGGGVKSRLLSSAPAPRSMGILSSESRQSVPAEPTRPNYHRIIVSNLQKSVTNEDIRELFEDVASLVSSKLVRPGTAEVVYRSRKDAVKAVDIYHNRQLDGEPMKCLLVNPRPPPAAAQPSASRNASTGSSHFRGSTSKFPSSKSQKPTVYPDMDTIHKALFKRS